MQAIKPLIILSKRINIITICSLMIVAGTSGCTDHFFPDRFIPLNPEEYFRPTVPDSIEVFAAQNPSRPYHEIGIFYLYNSGKNARQQVGRAKKFMADYGANAIIRLDITDTYLKGVAVRWK